MFIASLSFYKKLSRKRSFAIADYISRLIGDAAVSALDFGGGNMYLAERLVELHPRLQITGIDVVEDQNLDKKILEHPRIRFFTYSSQELPFEESSFDVAIASAVMHHTPDPEYYLSELKRVIKPGGSILLVEEMYLSIPDKLYIMAEDFILNKLKKGIPVPLQFRSYTHYKKEFEKQGLEVAFEGHIRPSFPWKHHYVFRLTKSGHHAGK